MATTYYVAKTGNDANPGTSVSPKLTINAGVALLSSGDILEIRAGTYNESMFNNAQSKFPNGTSSTNMTIIKGAAGDTVIWTAGGGFIFLIKDCGSYIKFDNIRFDGSNLTDADAVNCWKHFRQDGGTTTGLVINNCHFYNSPDNNVFIDIHTNGWQFTNNTVYDGGRHQPLGNNVYCEGNNHRLAGNRVYFTSVPSGSNLGALRCANNTGDGVGANNNTFENNYITGGGCNFGIIMGTGDNNIAKNNIVEGCKTGILMWQQGSWSQTNNRIYNNTVYNCTTGVGTLVFSLPLKLSNSKLKNNIIFSCTTAISDPNGVFANNTFNNLTSNPSFVNAGAGNFQLQSSSAAIDSGTTLTEVTTDYAGVSRPQGSAWDIGAYEFVGGGTPDTTPPTGLVIAPANGTTVTGTVTITCNASDNIGVANVQFYLDGSPLGGLVT